MNKCTHCQFEGLTSKTKSCPMCFMPNPSHSGAEPISLALGIVGVVFSWFAFHWVVAILALGISGAAVFLANKDKSTKNTKVALVLGIIGLALSVLLLVAVVLFRLF